MPVTIVLGASWGDEAKAKIVHSLAKNADAVVRFQGGCNAGHTVIHNSQKIIFHTLPIGILYPKSLCIIATGVVVDPFQLLAEIEEVEKIGYTIKNRLFLSSQAHITLPIHRFLDGKIENASKTTIGTTRKGIGPTYTDKYARLGIRMSDLLNQGHLTARIDNLISYHKCHLEDWLQQNSIEEMTARLLSAGKKLQEYVTDTPYLINKLLADGKELLYEGAQGTLLDIDFGTYPFVTSSNTTLGGAIAGTGINYKEILRVIGVIKAYFTRVGNGPFPTELKDDTGDYIRNKGNEYGATTGRPRRCGWFDAVAARYATMINSFDEIALTCLDVLSGLETLKICTQYRINGKVIEQFPLAEETLSQATPEYRSLSGWEKDISQIKDFSDLPSSAQKFIYTIEELIGRKVSIISVGPKKEQTIFRD
ncbi:MAG: adenylosuccinate synthase [Candidatus Cloacimonadia bacterium]